MNIAQFLPIILIVLLLLFMFRNGRKRQRDAAALTNTLRPGAEIMTTGGIYGIIESIDDEENRIVLKTGPTSEITVHRQAVGRVVKPVPDEDPALEEREVATLNGEPLAAPLSDADLTEPAYGERVGTDTSSGGDDVAARRATAQDERSSN